MIYKAKVLDNADEDKQGRLYVTIPTVFPKPVWVGYCSTFGGAGAACGFISIPPINAFVLVTELGNSKGEFVWLGVYLANSWDNDKKVFTTSIPEADSIYGTNGTPQKYLWISPGGNRVEISDKSEPGKNEDYIEISTSKGKLIKLDSSVQNEQIIIKDEKDNLIQVDSQSNTISMSTGNVLVYSKDGEVEIKVNSGKENITISNLGSGDVNIEADSGDISLKSKSGNVNIEGRQVNIEGKTNITLKTKRIDAKSI